ncbi:hypothetical protein O159_18450 [Leifsonia xyli subsp. cynodontis DSM 46306]|uniref:Methyltransferase small domain-containing protein n=1 Tax=Leifsonia xyli subsp. cynodontis DSM 46306 TaxID=1389489 RepID=U3P8S3_LEIXC|nr:hypothetical protein O159_18450 [Leifsonia xyli subsp. cynodontis DSM 46306]
MASGDHYFSPAPGSETNLRPFTARLAGQTYELVTASGIFSPERIDTGTRVLLDHVPPAPPSGQFLDLGWGPSLSHWLSNPLMRPSGRSTSTPEPWMWCAGMQRSSV